MDDAEILKIIKSKKISIRLDFLRNPTVPAKYLYKMLDDDSNDALQLVVSHQNINGNMINKIIGNNYRELDDNIYNSLCLNKNLKKEWVLKLIEFLKDRPRQSERILLFLEVSRLFSNDTEWLALYDYIYERSSNFGNGVIFKYFHSFFKFVLNNPSEQIVLTILDDYGVGISNIDPTFSCIVGSSMDTPVVRAKLFKITDNVDFLPKEATDIFLF